jgi:hypothetical protein
VKPHGCTRVPCRVRSFWRAGSRPLPWIVLGLWPFWLLGCARFTLTARPSSGVHNPILQERDINGVPTLAILPPSYNAQKSSPWIIYDHGIGGTIAAIAINPPQSDFVQALASAGFVVIGSDYRNLACWGNQECVEDLANLQALWRSRLNLTERPFAIGESMGGIVTWNAISHGTLRPLAVVGIYPVCNLAAVYAMRAFAPTIETAYGFGSSAGYAAATNGFDPMLAPPSMFAGFPIEIWASYSDRSVRRSQNEDPFARMVNAGGGNVVIHTSRGRHGDASNFDAPAVISFFSAHRM